MAYNYEYPYVDPNRYNSDWILGEMKTIGSNLENLIESAKEQEKELGVLSQEFEKWKDDLSSVALALGKIVSTNRNLIRNGNFLFNTVNQRGKNYYTTTVGTQRTILSYENSEIELDNVDGLKVGDWVGIGTIYGVENIYSAGCIATISGNTVTLKQYGTAHGVISSGMFLWTVHGQYTVDGFYLHGNGNSECYYDEKTGITLMTRDYKSESGAVWGQTIARGTDITSEYLMRPFTVSIKVKGKWYSATGVTGVPEDRTAIGARGIIKTDKGNDATFYTIASVSQADSAYTSFSVNINFAENDSITGIECIALEEGLLSTAPAMVPLSYVDNLKICEQYYKRWEWNRSDPLRLPITGALFVKDNVLKCVLSHDTDKMRVNPSIEYENLDLTYTRSTESGLVYVLNPVAELTNLHTGQLRGKQYIATPKNNNLTDANLIATLRIKNGGYFALNAEF